MLEEAVNVTGVPGQAPIDDAVIVIEGIAVLLMIMVTGTELTVAGETQAALESITTFTISPLTKEALVYIAEPAPAMLTPFTCH